MQEEKILVFVEDQNLLNKKLNTFLGAVSVAGNGEVSIDDEEVDLSLLVDGVVFFSEAQLKEKKFGKVEVDSIPSVGINLNLNEDKGFFQDLLSHLEEDDLRGLAKEHSIDVAKNIKLLPKLLVAKISDYGFYREILLKVVKNND